MAQTVEVGNYATALARPDANPNDLLAYDEIEEFWGHNTYLLDFWRGFIYSASHGANSTHRGTGNAPSHHATGKPPYGDFLARERLCHLPGADENLV